jgi:hypothetical protein
MNFPSSLCISALGLAFSFAACAQSPSPTPPPKPPDAEASMPAAPGTSAQLPVVTQSSRIRAFNAGPGGEVRSLYLQNGSVVDLTPALGRQLGLTVRKREKITVTGTKSEINGQSLVEAMSVSLNDQKFSANAAPPVPGALAENAAPPPPGAPQGPLPAPSSRRRNKAVGPAPCVVPADGPPPPPDYDGPPPPPDGMAPPPPPDGMPPPPPPQE